MNPEPHSYFVSPLPALDQLLSDDRFLDPQAQNLKPLVIHFVDYSAPSRAAADVLPLTVVFVEIPTNPDMKVTTQPSFLDWKSNPKPVFFQVPSIPALAAMLKEFTDHSGRSVHIPKLQPKTPNNYQARTSACRHYIHPSQRRHERPRTCQ